MRSRLNTEQIEFIKTLYKNETKNKKECTNNTTNIKVDSDGQS